MVHNDEGCRRCRRPHITSNFDSYSSSRSLIGWANIRKAKISFRVFFISGILFIFLLVLKHLLNNLPSDSVPGSRYFNIDDLRKQVSETNEQNNLNFAPDCDLLINSLFHGVRLEQDENKLVQRLVLICQEVALKRQVEINRQEKNEATTSKDTRKNSEVTAVRRKVLDKIIKNLTDTQENKESLKKNAEMMDLLINEEDEKIIELKSEQNNSVDYQFKEKKSEDGDNNDRNNQPDIRSAIAYARRQAEQQREEGMEQLLEQEMKPGDEYKEKPYREGNSQSDQANIELRRDMVRKYGTWYGCKNDPTIQAMKGVVIKGNDREEFLKRKSPKVMKSDGEYDKMESRLFDELNADKLNYVKSRQISLIATPPYRFGLLFIINKELRHSKLWVEWLRQAHRWSYSLYKKREGPYRNVTENESFVPLFSLHVHFMGSSGGFFASLKNVWRRWGLSAVEDSLIEAENDPRYDLPKIFQDSIIPGVHCGWGDLNPCEYQLLKYGLKDSNTNGFTFLSESTVPVKPFQFIYEQFQKNPRSRFFFSNVNLPIVRKHHQWIVLNRRHAGMLVANSAKWICNTWMVHHYPTWHIVGNYAAADEYLPFHAITDLLGIDTVMTEINNGQEYDLRIFNNTHQVYGDRNYRHTWLCWWELPDYIDIEPCGRVGHYSTRLASPVTYYQIFERPFLEIVVQNRNAWFARKFEKDCTVLVESKEISQKSGDSIFRASSVGTNSITDSHRRINDTKNDNPISLEDWLMEILITTDIFSKLPLSSYDADIGR